MAPRSPRSRSKTSRAPAKKPTKPTKPRAPAKRKAVKRPSTSAQEVEDARSRERALAVAKAALDKKAEDVLLIDVRGLTSIAEYFVVASGSAGPQLRAIAESIEVELKKKQAMPISVEGRGGGWVLIDYGDVVAHVFEPESRRFYDLEGLWADAPRERIEG